MHRSAKKKVVPKQNVVDMQVHVSRATAFFKKAPWDQWWQEFLGSRKPNGQLQYLTAWNFARAKGRTKYEKELIYEAIGPKRVGLDVLKEKKAEARIPYLGDWHQIRAKAYFYDKESLDKLRVVVAERLEQIEAVRGTATVWLDLMAKYVKFDDDIDQAFDMSPVVQGLSPQTQGKRAGEFYRIKRENFEFLKELGRLYLLCHGMSTSDVPAMANLIGAVAQGAAQGAAAGAGNGQHMLTVSPALDVLTRAIVDKTRIFNMPLPAVVNSGEHEEEERS